MDFHIRLLTAREIECRVAQISKTGKGLSLLLYKDARCDMAILDETFGPMNWQRHHSRDNANCIVSIWDDTKNQWIDKEDTGTESNTEAAKGLASDSFKRACFNVGIGRELYTAPFIWIGSDKCKIEDSNGRRTCNDKFEVQEIGYNDHREINKLVIVNSKTKAVVFEYSSNARKGGSKPPATAPKQEPTQTAEPAESGVSDDFTPATEEQKAYIKGCASDEDYLGYMEEFGAELERLSYKDAEWVKKEIDKKNAIQPPRCVKCDKVITGIALPDGSRMTAGQLIEKSKATYNGIYCFDCMKKLAKKK